MSSLPPMLRGLAMLLLLQLVGMIAATLLHLPIPGTVIGLVLLAVLAVWRPTRGIRRIVGPAGTPLLRHLQLLFVPPGVGIVVELSSLAQNALPLALAVGGSFVVTLVLAGHLLQVLLRRHDRRAAEA